MLKIKNFIFYFIIVYIIIFSVLFTYKIFDLKKVVNKELESEQNTEHHDFINDSLYKKVGKSEKYKNKDNCALTIYDAIELEKRKRYDESLTYKDLYRNYSHNTGVFRIQSCNDVIKYCNLKENDDLKQKFISHCTHDLATVEYYFYNDYIKNLSLNMDFPINIYNYYIGPAFDHLRANEKLDLRSELISEQREYVNILLKIGGFDYE